MTFLFPWSVLVALPVRAALAGLTDAVADRDTHAVRAYVALRMLHTRIHRLHEPEDVELCLSEEAAESLALYATGQGPGPWEAVANILYITMEEADGPEATPTPQRDPGIPTVRATRARLVALT